MIANEFYKQALLIRRTEDTFLELFSQGKMNGTVHTCNGQEFSAIAFSKSLQENDFIYSNHRCHGHYIAHTHDVEGLIAELMGKESGTCGGIGSSQHLCNDNFYSNGIQGGIVPVAAGMAFANKMKKNNQIGAVFIGDGTLGQGVVYETLNLVSLLALPLLIICEDNGYAQSTTQNNNLAGDILLRAEAFGVKTFHSNTWDTEQLFTDAEDSVDYVRRNCKPAFHLVNTYRLNHHSKSDDNRCEKEVDEYVKKDPLNIYKVNNKTLYEEMLLSVDKEIKNIVDKVGRDNEQPFLQYIKRKNNKEQQDEYVPVENLGVRVVSRINQFFDEVIEKDKKVLFIGEDVLSPYGGAFKVAANLSEKYPDNVISTPISEQAITGLANGLALGGFKPYLEIMFGDFITLSLDQIINHASKFYHMYNKKIQCPIVIRTPMGGGRGYGPTHSQTLDKFLVGIDNVTLVALNSFIDPKIIYNEIYENEGHPVIVVENKVDYGKIVGAKEQTNYTVQRTIDGYPVIKCSPELSEATLTIISYGGIASEVFDVLTDIFYETELIPELYILTKISPLNLHAVIDSVKKSKRIVVVEEGGGEFGIGAEIISSIIEQIGTSNIELIQRIGALPIPIPSARTLEEHVLPNKTILEKIVQGVRL
jgi:2-oxoisovalerate dehydrogenase E1 component